MIVLPAIPAIIAAVTPFVQAALVSAGIGAVVGGGIGAVGGAVEGYQEHGEINREVFDDAARGAIDGGIDGAMLGFVIGPIGPLVGPAIGPAIQVVDDVARPVIQVADDVAAPLIQTADDAIRPVAQGVDDLLSPLVRRRSPAAGPVSTVFNAPNRIAVGTRNAQQYKSMSANICRKGCNYTMYDDISGATKSGITTRHPSIRLAEVGRDVGRPVTYRSIHPGNSLKQVRETERAIHQTFAYQQNMSMPGREWFDLNPFGQLSVRAWTP